MMITMKHESRPIKIFIITFVISFILIHAAVCLAANSCTISTTPATLTFSPINPASSVNAISNVSNITINCTGNPNWTLYDFGPACLTTGGLYDTGGSHRMRHMTVPTEYLPYTVTFTPATGTKFITSSSIQAVVTPAGFQNAMVGTYQDTLTITICP